MVVTADLDIDVDAEVTFSYRIHNPDSSPVVLRFRSGQRFDVVVNDARSGRQIWQASDGRAYPMVMSTIELDPGDSRRFEERMPRPDPGEYEAIATLAATDIEAPTVAQFSVP